MNATKNIQPIQPDAWNTKVIEIDRASIPLTYTEIPKVRWFIRANGERVLQWHSISSSGDDVWEDVQEVRE